MTTLLEKALAAKRTAGVPDECIDEEIELAVAWLRGEVGHAQTGRAVGLFQSNSIYSFICTRLKAAYKLGVISITPKGE